MMRTKEFFTKEIADTRETFQKIQDKLQKHNSKEIPLEFRFLAYNALSLAAMVEQMLKDKENNDASIIQMQNSNQ